METTYCYAPAPAPVLVHDQLLSFFNACHESSSRQDFIFKVYPKLREIFPHSNFVCGTASVDSLTIDHLINISFPERYLKKITGPDGRINSPLVSLWLKSREPVFYDEQHGEFFNPAWQSTVLEYGLSSMAAHGMLDISGKETSYFCFAGLPEWNNRTRVLLELIVPHLHVAVTRQLAARAISDVYSLSPREYEVLKLICIGKTNSEIGLILGISPWTVKIHVRNFMSKMNVSTRGHAAAKAIKSGVVYNLRT